MPVPATCICSVPGCQSSSSSQRCAASITSGGAGFCSQARMRNKPPTTVPTASTATMIQNRVDMSQVWIPVPKSAREWSGSQGRGEGGVENLRVASRDGEIAAQRLGDDHAIEWILVTPGKPAGQDRVG